MVNRRRYHVETHFSDRGKESYRKLGFGSDVAERIQEYSKRLSGTKAQRSEQIFEFISSEATRMNRIIKYGINQHLNIPFDENISVDKQTAAASTPSLLWPGILSSVSLCLIPINPVIPAIFIPVILAVYMIKCKKISHINEEIERDNAIALQLAENVCTGHSESMDIALDRALNHINLYMSTSVDYDISENGKQISLSIALPTLEDMPGVTMVAVKTRLSIKGAPKSKKDQKIEHETYCCGVLLRVACLSFHLLPTLEQVVCAGCINDSSIPDSDQQAKQYAISMSRAYWKNMNIHNIDPIALVKSGGLLTEGK